jgi:hypothetical protein
VPGRHPRALQPALTRRRNPPPTRPGSSTSSTSSSSLLPLPPPNLAPPATRTPQRPSVTTRQQTSSCPPGRCGTRPTPLGPPHGWRAQSNYATMLTALQNKNGRTMCGSNDLIIGARSGTVPVRNRCSGIRRSGTSPAWLGGGIRRAVSSAVPMSLVVVVRSAESGASLASGANVLRRTGPSAGTFREAG